MAEIKYNIKTSTDKVVLPEKLGFGIYFTNHVFEMDYEEGIGWHNAQIKPLENLSLHPATMFIHYGQALFEGMKAFKQHTGEIVLFRAENHFARLNKSAKRLCMPEVDVDFVLSALRELINVDKEWVPSEAGQSLYVRPFMFGTEPHLGVKSSSSFKFMILLSPVGAYYAEGFKPVRILVQDEYVRAVRKGMGECKTPGNYAASLMAAELAKKNGYSQVLWLDGVEQKYIEEVGAMNIFVVFKNEIVTPKLSGSILSGITRLSVLEILRDWRYTVSERQLSIDELCTEFDKGNVIDVFGTGTAAVISSVGELKYKDKVMIINNGEVGELAQKLFTTLTSIQSGISEDTHQWITSIDVETAIK